jgi:hypothetical protein
MAKVLYIDIAKSNYTRMHPGGLFLIFIYLLLLTAGFMTLSGCTYTRYTYSVDNDIPHDESWSIRFFFWPVGSFVPASESPNHTDTAFYYAVAFCELDTTKYSRMGFAIDHVKLTYAGIREPTTLLKDKEISHAGENVGATDVCHSVFF